MSNVTRTIARDLPNGDYIEVTAEMRNGSDGLSPGFSVTAAVWERRGNAKGRTRKRQGRDCDLAGCIHDAILAAFPNLAPVVAVHLADLGGLPMHAKANGWYFYSGGASAYEREKIAKGQDWGYSRNLQASDHDRAAQALNIDPADLPAGLDREGFHAFVDSLANRYADMAQRAREAIESLTDGQGVEL